ncbi:uncharacterized protein LOC110011297 [Sesamum indicum]|uniref:Uncharacterized protein LOC110011297 n=1 Tax=Sesamum indicum TaxID=4182 RepID=A0A8M8USQ1_SESIN|nr:uncharacterized protein LOC110011297 [Sesamum indicum]
MAFICLKALSKKLRSSSATFYGKAHMEGGHFKPYPIWVSWINSMQLHGKSIWTVDATSSAWGWRKLLPLRSTLQPHIRYMVGDGEMISLWNDPWHPLGPLIQYVPRGPSLTRTCGDDLLRAVIQDGEWHWPRMRNAFMLDVTRLIPLISGVRDSILLDGGFYANKIVYDIFRHSGPKMEGKHVVNAAYRNLLASLVYHIWQEWNRRRYQQLDRDALSLVRIIIDEIRLHILSAELPHSISTIILCRVWRIPWYT